MIYQTIDTLGQFIDAFYMAGRRNEFSYEAKEVLFDYYSEIGDDIELDITAICCYWVEIPVETIQRETGCEDIETLEEYTVVWSLDNGNILYAAF